MNRTQRLFATNDTHQDDDGEVFFWDPLSSKNRNTKNQNHERQLQEQLAQATMKIRDLETELKCFQKDEPTEGHQKVEFLRAKQDMVNRIIQMEEKNREAERNTKRMQLDEMALINDFRTVLSKLNSLEKLDLVRNALKALETENEKYGDLHKRHDGFIEASNNRESELYKKIEELQEENKRLFSSVEQLDQQHEESIEKLLSLKEEIEKKHQCLQNAYEQLYVDYNQAQDKVVQLEDRLTSTVNRVQVETVSLPVQTARVAIEDRLVQTDVPETNEERNDKNDIDVVTARVQEILKNTFVETEPGVSIFEAVAKQYVDAKWKRDVLEKTVMELNRKLKEAVEAKDYLQDACYDMQIHNDSLLLEIQDLKLNLPSIPEASEERVAWLESETESLHEQVKRLQTKNTALRRENAKLGGGGMIEIRLENQGHQGTASKNRKLTRLEDIPEGVEETDSAVENLNNRLHTTLDENDELRRKIDVLENTGKETQEQLRMSLEKCKGLDENIEFIEELKLELENVKRELKTSIANRKQLENSLALLQETKDGVQKENEELYQRIKQLEMGASKWSEINLERENNVLQELQEQLGRVNREKDDLEYDILNMRKELDEAFNQIDTKESHITKLNQDNENLMKEKNSLLEQLTAIQDESNDKIDLVNTEKSLLEQEQIELKEIEANKEKELSELKEQLRESEGRYTKLENEFSSVNVKAEQLRLQNENLQNKVIKQEELKNELDRTKLTIERLNSIENDYSKLVKEVETLREKEKALIALQEHFAKLMEENKSLISLNESIQDKLMQTQNRELVNHPNGNNCDNEKQQIIDLLEEKTRENDALKINNDKLMAEIIESQKKLQSIIESNKESTDMAKQTIESLSHLVSKKDEEINNLKATLDLAKSNAEMSDNFATIKNERDELVKLVTVKHNESLQYHGEIQRLTQLLTEQASKIQNLVSEKEIDLSRLTETNAELLWAKNELQVAQQRLKHTENSVANETCGIVEHSKQIAEIALLNEKCNALEASLIQEQSNNRMLQHQFTESQNKEANAAKELERLRTHLVEIESTYTEEALIAEETRNELEAKLLQAEEKVKSSSTAYTSANIRANQQVETLQQQITLIIQQRDEIQNKLSTAEDTILSQAASLTNLQFVLEQFQRDKERDIKAAMERLQAKLNDSYKKQEELVNDVTSLKEQLAEAKECLQAASRLSEQLDKKTERIEQLNQEVDRLTNLVNTANHRIEEAKESEEGQIDKTLVKNLFLSYLSSSAADKSSVLRVFSTILEFSDVEKEKVGLSNATTQNSWFPRLSSGSTVVNKDQDTSLSAAFVRFLESESKPKPQLPALPIQTSSLPRPGHSRQHSTSSTQSTLLLSNVNLPTFPDFVPARNTGSILKEVLKDS
ncbi:thyroid receptor-interacting protein 11-like isoform X2 [Colletes gigas]|uniref:thyroid receptor-interacting protein 11-like isoform X2 n=1 Tax=Colletes gigas TaxID=935657 RepID=UPI001C9B343A|nr:thyroid receptor-interacting protein 11-like isoform X2 [Colletes gigas]